MMEVTLKLSDPVVIQSKHTMPRNSIIILATGSWVAKTLIKYSNNMEENDEDEKEPINIELTEQKTDPDNYENAIDFRWSDAKEDIAFTNFIKFLQKQTDEENFSKK